MHPIISEKEKSCSKRKKAQLTDLTELNIAYGIPYHFRMRIKHNDIGKICEHIWSLHLLTLKDSKL